MTLLEVIINNKVYKIGCEEQDKEKLKECVAKLNKRIEDFKNLDPTFFMSLNDERLFLFQLLILISEQDNIEKSNQEGELFPVPQIETQNIYHKECKQIQESLDNIKIKIKKIENLL